MVPVSFIVELSENLKRMTNMNMDLLFLI